jgi:hypothetical protein
MKNLIIFVAILLFNACGKPEEPQINYKTTTIYPEVSNLFAPAQKGSYFIFRDSISGKYDSIYIAANTESKVTYYCADSKYTYPKRLTIDYHSSLNNQQYSWLIQINSNCEDTLNWVEFYRRAGTGASFNYTPKNGFFQRIGSPTVFIEKHNTFKVKDSTYKNVYHFTSGDYNFYWAENIGIIKYNEIRLGVLNGVTIYEQYWELIRYKLIN